MASVRPSRLMREQPGNALILASLGGRGDYMNDPGQSAGAIDGISGR